MNSNYTNTNTKFNYCFVCRNNVSEDCLKNEHQHTSRYEEKQNNNINALNLDFEKKEEKIIFNNELMQSFLIEDKKIIFNKEFKNSFEFQEPYTEFQKVINKINTNENKYNLNHAMGCCIGAFIGDSIGSYVEFQHKPSKKDVELALEMPGGGTWGIAPGQLTDDSELGLSLAYGLVEGKGILNLESIGNSYKTWLKSHPFDCGRTCYNGLSQISSNKNYDKMFKIIANLNKSSQSNGGIMRITPLAIWCLRLESIEDIKKAVYSENAFTHSDETVLEAAFIYVLAINYLVNSNGNLEESFNKIKTYMEENNKNNPIWEWWILVEKEIFMPGVPNMGWVKIAWSYSFIFLKQKRLNYLEIMKFILLKGGDTDTNCCIVGGMLGAMKGFKNLPEKQVNILLECDFSKGRKKRIDRFYARNIVNLVEEIFEIAPKKLEIYMP